VIVECPLVGAPKSGLHSGSAFHPEQNCVLRFKSVCIMNLTDAIEMNSNVVELIQCGYEREAISLLEPPQMDYLQLQRKNEWTVAAWATLPTNKVAVLPMDGSGDKQCQRRYGRQRPH
jgi:hypothetical protein